MIWSCRLQNILFDRSSKTDRKLWQEIWIKQNLTMYTGLKIINQSIKKYLKRIINSHNSGWLSWSSRNKGITEACHTIIQSIQNSSVLWTIDPLSVHSIIKGGGDSLLTSYYCIYWTSWLEKNLLHHHDWIVFIQHQLLS